MSFFHICRESVIAEGRLEAHDLAMFRTPFTRGSSVLAALVLVAILSFAAIAMHGIVKPLNGRSQVAGVDLATGKPATTAAAGEDKDFKSTAPKDCAAAIKAATDAAAKNSTPQPIVQTVTSQSGTVDACYGAFQISGSKPSTKPEDYQCRGREGEAMIQGLGMRVTTRVAASKPPEPGECKIKVCTLEVSADGHTLEPRCKDAEIMKGVAASGGKLTEGGGTPSIPSIPGATASDPQAEALKAACDQNSATWDAGVCQTLTQERANITGSFLTPQQKMAAATEISENEAKIKDVQSYLNDCASQCPDTAAKQAELKALEARNAELSKQLMADQVVLTPEAPSAATCAANPAAPGCGAAATPSGYQGPCQNGGTMNPLTGECSAKGNTTGYQGPLPRPDPRKANAEVPDPTPTKTSGGLGAGLNQMMQGLLGGLTKALTGAATGSGQTCSTDSNTYAQQQQLYNQQLQQYNYQLQQYNQQMYYGNGYMSSSPPTPPQPCTPSTGSQCATAPAQPSASTCTSGSWKPTYTGSCVTGWQCVPTSGTSAPTASLSCQPRVADVGMTVAVTYACANATGSSALGFSTGGALSGSATTTVVTPTAGTDSNTLTLTCANGSVTSSARCEIDVTKPSIVLVANPKVVKSGEATTIGWITSGMRSCIVSSPDLADFTARNASNTSVNGMASTSPLLAPAQILLHCVTLGGGTKDATTTISVIGQDGGDVGDFSIAATSTADAATTTRGSKVTITWVSTAAPADSRMSLWLYDTRLSTVSALIKDDLPRTGSYEWTLPAAGSACDSNSNIVCAADLVPGRRYGIEASLYKPASSSVDVYYYGSAYTPDPFTVGE